MSAISPRQAIARLMRAMDLVGIDVTGIGRIVVTDPKTVSRWLRYETEPQRELGELLLPLGVVLERLALVIERGAAEDWLFTPAPMLDLDRPVDRLRRGDYQSVIWMIDAIGEGVFT